MIKVNFPQGIDRMESDPLTQWDKHQKLELSGLGVESTDIYQVHFCNDNSKQAIKRLAYPVDGGHSVDIPNSLLRDGLTISAYVYLTSYETATVDATTEGEYFTESDGIYTKVSLPREYTAGVTYYKQVGATVKTVKIEVRPRKKPDDYIDAGDPTEEELLDELLRYCNNLGHRLEYYTSLVNQYRSKDLVQLVSQAEYDALVAAGKVETGVIYVIEGEGTIEEIAEAVKAAVVEEINTPAITEEVRLAISEGINNGEIAVSHCENADNADSATTADEATVAQGVKYTLLYSDTTADPSDTVTLDEHKDGIYFCKLNVTQWTGGARGNTTTIPSVIIPVFGTTYAEANPYEIFTEYSSIGLIHECVVKCVYSSGVIKASTISRNEEYTYKAAIRRIYRIDITS